MNPYIYAGLKVDYRTANKAKSLPQRNELIEDVIKHVCKTFEITQEQLFSKNRQQNLVNARQLTMLIFRYYMDMTLHEIGKIFQQDHSTVIHSLKKAGMNLECEFYYREKLSECVEFNFGWTLATPKIIAKAINWMNQKTKP